MAGVYPVENVILATDSYKTTHHLQYPPGTSTVYSYFESRGGRFPYTVFFGLQYIIKRWLVGPVITESKIKEAKEICQSHIRQDAFNEEGWKHILMKHKGHLPLRIKAVPEGSVIPTRNVLFTVENTDPVVPWLTNWFETLLVQTWYPTTVATNSRCQKELLAKYLCDTADDLNTLPMQLHDFGFRGCSSVESAAIGGAAHMVNFISTDSIAGLLLIRNYYGCKMAGFSIPATEHSTMTTWGVLGELEACRNMLNHFPSGTLAVVSDSYDVFNCCENIWGTELKPSVEARGKQGGVLIIRPDSGDPATVVLKILNILGKQFGTTKNKKGYKLLPPYVRLIQGDGISYKTLEPILQKLKENEWSTDNVFFGSGGALLQKLDRDTMKCAYKCSFAVVDGKKINVFKKPITDPGKHSKKGWLSLEKQGNSYLTIEEGLGDPEKDLLVTVFENGKLIREYTLDEVRRNAELDIVKNSRKI
ncbi:nicotinamide phosphoribosyltransferase-like isoform X1 [Tachypleus tridentatus]|uniref:nicotinamide phosphoribosyltransferase-like isoform X1 n=2 Tax=Tachypleus tridentatus TaxID=6853 RepID=UPI003FCF37F5